MTVYELIRRLGEPALPLLSAYVRRDLSGLIGTEKRCELLDIGGRKSPYTVGLRADVTILDVPRQSTLQHRLNLGVSDAILAELRRRRSNIVRVVIEDMTRCTLPDASFDAAVSVEVIEHVVDDERFVAQIARVLRPGGWVLITTPNGDYIKNEPPNHNPDHVRHYTRSELGSLLGRHFDRVDVRYAIKTGPHRARGLRSLDVRHPVRSAQTVASNLINRIESRDLDATSTRTAHLFAIARKH